MARHRISILCADFSGNCLARAYNLAKLLQDAFDVHIVAFGEGDQVWEHVRNDATIEYRRYFYRTVPELWFGARRIVRRLIDGDVIFAVKPLHQSFGLGLLARRLIGKPLILDIDDWEMGFLSDSIYWEFRWYLSDWFMSPNSPLFTRCLDRLTGAADAITTSNTFLQNRFGGTWIPHARNEKTFHPVLMNGDRRDKTIQSKTVVFLGTARLHKGLDDLLKAWAMVVEPSARLRIIGTPPDSPLINAIRPLADARTSFEPPIPYDMVSSMLSSIGIAVIPQKMAEGSVGQLPAKLIDSMGAGNAIIATKMGDMPRWLEGGAGLVVPPNDPPALANAIKTLLDQPEMAARLGRKAQDRFQRFGSFAVVQPRLVKLVSDVMAHRPLSPPEPVCFKD